MDKCQGRQAWESVEIDVDGLEVAREVDDFFQPGAEAQFHLGPVQSRTVVERETLVRLQVDSEKQKKTTQSKITKVITWAIELVVLRGQGLSLASCAIWKIVFYPRLDKCHRWS